MTYPWIKAAAAVTPDPERAENNLVSFIEENPGKTDELEAQIRSVAPLFSCSQFLANFCIAHPDALFHAIRDLGTPADPDGLALNLRQQLSEGAAPAARGSGPPAHSLGGQMTVVRRFRTEGILRAALRDILRTADLVDVMLDMSNLADVIISESVAFLRRTMNETFGLPAQDSFAVIGLGKLGGQELNFSSDVDLIFVYGTEVGETGGILTQQGVTTNRISNHEYYCKLGESLARFLSLSTEAAFAYRVDLRLRPEGQRGDLALALRGYEMYYESWGRAWERAMLIRARPVGGDAGLGRDFLTMIRPFVYRKYLDYTSIDEIRRLKTRIDSTFKKGDIKRGPGGIREIEFFTQALQLIYGGREPLLRERSILKALHLLLQKSLVGQEDYASLSDNYRHFRTLEHRLQQLNDIQTHAVPSGVKELEILGRKMGFHDGASFSADLDQRRSRVRAIYDSLFSGKAEEQSLGGTFFDEEMSDAELKEYLAEAGLREPDRAARSIKAIKDSTFVFQTLRGRRLLGEILPAFVDAALASPAPDVALNHLQTFAQLLSANESYLEIFIKDRDLITMLTRVFSQSEYLTKLLISRPQYLEMIGWEDAFSKSPAALRREILNSVDEGRSLNDAVRLVRQAEEIRLGLLFLQKKPDSREVMRGLSKTAEAVLSLCLEHVGEDASGLAIVGLGKLGGREITFGSDLDIIFVAGSEPSPQAVKAAERILRMLISYTREGVAYRVDTRLRPEGSKGPLVSSIESLRKYYAGSAAGWELQALLKARPVAGNTATSRAFLSVGCEALMARGREVTPAGIRQMRDRILRELARETKGYDVKLGPGGTEDLEFLVQYLQLTNCHSHRKLLVQGTLHAIRRLAAHSVIEQGDAAFIRAAYLYYRTIEGYLRLRGVSVLGKDSLELHSVADFMGYSDVVVFVRNLEQTREKARSVIDRYMG